MKTRVNATLTRGSTTLTRVKMILPGVSVTLTRANAALKRVIEIWTGVNRMLA
jgi:hypothetical protein